jgi:hypothetical protein
MHIIIACWLANGQYVEPRGHYQSWAHCDKYVEYFQTELFPTIGNKGPLCWCSKRPAPAMPKPERAIRYDNDRKAPR